MNLIVSALQRNFGSFVRTEHTRNEHIKIAAGNAFLDVHSEPSLWRERDQSMLAAVADVKADRMPLPVHHGKRLSMLASAELELLIRAVELSTKNGAQRRAAQGVPASRAIMLVPPPTRLLPFIEPCQGISLTPRMGREIDVYDDSVINLSERTPPAFGNRSRYCQVTGRRGAKSPGRQRIARPLKSVRCSRERRATLIEARSGGLGVEVLDQGPQGGELRAVLDGKVGVELLVDQFPERNDVHGGHAGIRKTRIQVNWLGNWPPIDFQVLFYELSNAIFG